MAVDADTMKCLEDVRKGKPRRFVLVGKGVRILSLVVYKKGSIEKYKKQAKEDGNGQLYYGVIDGKGVNLCFKLLRSEGFDKPPGKELILKDFLLTQAEMKCKPTYEIVDELPAVEEDDDELDTSNVSTGADENSGRTAGSSPELGNAPAVASPTDNDLRLVEQFNARLLALMPRIKRVAGTPDGETARKQAITAAALAKNREFSPGHERLDEVEHLLNGTTGAGPLAPPAPVIDPLADSFKTRLATLIPQIKQVVGTPAGDAARQTASDAGESARQKDFPRAHALLDEVERLLAPRGSETEEDPAQRHSERARLARVVARGDNPFPHPGDKLEPELREVFQGPVETAKLELQEKLDSVFERIRALHAEIKSADEERRRLRAPELLQQLAGYREALETLSTQLASLVA